MRRYVIRISNLRAAAGRNGGRGGTVVHWRHAVARAHIEAEEFVLVVGAGPIGLSVIQFARLARTKVIAMDVNQDRLGFVRENFTIEAAIEAGEGAIEQIREITGGDLTTGVFDATGNLQSMNASFNLPANGGRLVLVGLCQGHVTFHDPDAHRRELTLLWDWLAK